MGSTFGKWLVQKLGYSIGAWWSSDIKRVLLSDQQSKPKL